tara:strand:+ start:268 stop:438 length:171 start_codon:yes stop_codon:yes gene_type:complete
MILALFFAINGLLSLSGFLFPNIGIDKIMPIQLWLNALLLFSVFLKNNVASFLPSL